MRGGVIGTVVGTVVGTVGFLIVFISGFGVQISGIYSGTGGVLSSINTSGITLEITSGITLGGAGSCGGLFVLAWIFLPERWGLCE